MLFYITCKINSNIVRKYFIGKHHSQDCDKVYNNTIELDNMISIKDDKTLKKEFITKIKNYMINNKLVKITLKNIKGYAMHVYYYFIFLEINPKMYQIFKIEGELSFLIEGFKI